MKAIYKVLIVDDEMLIRQGIKHLMDWESVGFRIIGEAANGIEALELVEQLQPQIILTDIVMPKMDGEKFVKVVKDKYPGIAVIVLSSFSEFEYVRSTFQNGVSDYILKPKLEADYLLSALNKAAATIPDSLTETSMEPAEEKWLQQAVGKLIAGYEVELPPDIVQKVLPYDSYTLFGFVIKKGSATSQRSEALGIMEATLQQLSSTVYTYLPDKNYEIFILNANDLNWESIAIELRAMIVQITSKIVSPIHFIMTEPFFDLKQIGAIYRNQYDKLSRYSFYLPDQLFISLDDLHDLPKIDADIDMVELIDLIKWKQFQQAFDSFMAHVYLKANDYRTDIFEFKALLSNFIFNVTSTLSKMKYATEPLENKKYKLFRKIDEAVYARDAIQWVLEILYEIEQIIEDPHTVASLNMKKLLSYIHEHYDEPITLTEVAQQFHFNPSYLSSYFSAHNSEGFSEYVNKVRVHKAMELLQSTQEPISEISSRVGYSDQSYFTKVFKRITGLSPSSYRREQNLERNE